MTYYPQRKRRHADPPAVTVDLNRPLKAPRRIGPAHPAAVPQVRAAKRTKGKK
jgi:hypothetical protein